MQTPENDPVRAKLARMVERQSKMQESMRQASKMMRDRRAQEEDEQRETQPRRNG